MCGGVFGDWSTGFTSTWQVKNNHVMTPNQRQEIKREIKCVNQKWEAAKCKQHKIAAYDAQKTWRLAQPEIGTHNYFLNKNISGDGLRSNGFILLVPMYDVFGRMWNIQRIYPNGKKLFQKGARVSGLFCPIGKPDEKVLLICEGFATDATLYQATGHAVAVAFTAWNLKAVAIALCEKYPNFEITICADNDRFTCGNPGITKAREAAFAINAKLAIPQFPDDVHGTDFNDLAQLAEVFL